MLGEAREPERASRAQAASAGLTGLHQALGSALALPAVRTAAPQFSHLLLEAQVQLVLTKQT